MKQIHITLPQWMQRKVRTKLTPPLQAKIREVCAEYDERNDHDEYLDARAVLLEALDRLEKEQAA